MHSAVPEFWGRLECRGHSALKWKVDGWRERKRSAEKLVQNTGRLEVVGDSGSQMSARLSAAGRTAHGVNQRTRFVAAGKSWHKTFSRLPHDDLPELYFFLVEQAASN